MHIALLFIAISLIVINYSFYQSMSKCTKKFGYNIVVTIPKKTITLDPEKLLRRDTCYLNKEDNCKVGSYKQCTNNVKPISNCDCKEPYFELCSPISSSSSKDKSIALSSIISLTFLAVSLTLSLIDRHRDL